VHQGVRVARLRRPPSGANATQCPFESNATADARSNNPEVTDVARRRLMPRWRWMPPPSTPPPPCAPDERAVGSPRCSRTRCRRMPRCRRIPRCRPHDPGVRPRRCIAPDSGTGPRTATACSRGPADQALDNPNPATEGCRARSREKQATGRLHLLSHRRHAVQPGQ